jgi:hypothetical protein
MWNGGDVTPTVLIYLRNCTVVDVVVIFIVVYVVIVVVVVVVVVLVVVAPRAAYVSTSAITYT